jgi:hypothetical protein
MPTMGCAAASLGGSGLNIITYSYWPETLYCLSITHRAKQMSYVNGNTQFSARCQEGILWLMPIFLFWFVSMESFFWVTIFDI